MSDGSDGSAPLVSVLAVVGTGLIGGSFAAALRRVGQAGRVLGVGRNPASLRRARDLGLIDEIADACRHAGYDERLFRNLYDGTRIGGQVSSVTIIPDADQGFN